MAYPAATLYGHLGQSSALYDVTSGGNGYCDGEANGPCGEPEVNELIGNVDCQGTTACDAATGFDGPSALVHRRDWPPSAGRPSARRRS